ncbi:Kinase domain containing protein [Ceratobasidium theobromae]|uniref:Kinase domain containing protein n=1 Tax=Ceratobasidium theobromae TaxID=1582974 RepID=A0A5N5Q965_9AGAM|nr:Kinase domain containing protein [Ceratobasidium theobromae]
MSETVLIDELELNILIDGEDPCEDRVIRATYKRRRHRSLGHVILFKFNKPSEEYEDAKFSRAMVLNLIHKVRSASGWPVGSDFDDSLIHIVARVKDPAPKGINQEKFEPSENADERMEKHKREQDKYLLTLGEHTASQAAQHSGRILQLS